MPEQTFKQHVLSPAERLWLSEMALSPSFSSRYTKVKLHGKLPPGFSANQIDSRLKVGDRLTPVGLWHVNPSHPLFDGMDKAIRAVQDHILRNPFLTSVTANQIAATTGLSERAAAEALYAAGTLARFFSSATGDGSSYTEIQLTDDDVVDEYLQYIDINHLLERFYADRGKALALAADSSFGLAASAGENAAATARRTIKPNTAFVIMRIDPRDPQLEDVYEAITAVCKEFGIVASRADVIEHQEVITERVLLEIRTSEYLIADLSDERPNVYYEVGYAHAHNARPILIRRAGTRLHFDLAGYNVPEYSNVTALRKLLYGRLESLTGRSPTSTRNTLS